MMYLYDGFLFLCPDTTLPERLKNLRILVGVKEMENDDNDAYVEVSL